MVPRETLMAALVCAAILGVTTSVVAAPAPFYDWVTRDRIRGGYMASNDPLTGVAQMKAVGMNLLMPKFGGLQAPPTEANVKLLRAWGEAAEASGMKLMPVFNFRGGETEKIIGDRREVTASGERMKATACPLDESFWQRYILGRAVWLAEHGKELHLTGTIIDPEMYGADHTVYMGVCYCDDCLREFLQAAGQPVPAALPAPAQRPAWLKEQGLTDKFEQRYTERIKGFCTQIEREVHAKNPEFLLGVLLLDYPLPFMRAMAQGLGTETHPVLAFSESTYSPGYTEYVDKQQAAFAALPAHALFVPGLWQQQFPSENLAEQYFTCATHSAGYWIYTFESLLEDVSKLPGYSLGEPNERYWAAMELANAELDKLAADAKYASALKVRPFDPPLPVLTTGDLKVEPLVAAPDEKPLSLGPVTAPRLRYRNPLYILAKAGEPVEARVTNLQLANYRPGTQYAVVAPDGKRLLEGHLKVTESAGVKFTPEQEGVYLLVAESGQNSQRVELITGQRCAFKAAKGQALTVNGIFGRVYFWVPEGVTQFSVLAKAEGQAPGRGGKLAVYSPDGQAVAHLEGDLGSWTEMPVSVPPAMQKRVWALSAEELTNDLNVYLSPNVSPYVSTDPQRVLTRP